MDCFTDSKQRKVLAVVFPCVMVSVFWHLFLANIADNFDGCRHIEDSPETTRNAADVTRGTRL